jgi:tetratricopeptide (TPR) repeat protein
VAEVPALHAEAIAALNRDAFDTAFALSRQVLTRDPSFTAAYRVLADAAFRAGRPQDALRVFEGLHAAGPTNPSPLFALGVCQRRLGRLPEAQESLRKALQLAPEWLEAYREYLKVARALGALDTAVRKIQQRGASAEILYAQAHAHELAFRFVKADALLDRSLALKRLPDGFLSRASIRSEQGRYRECVEAAREGVRVAEAQGDTGRLRAELLLLVAQCDFGDQWTPTRTALALASAAGDQALEGDALRQGGPRAWPPEPATDPLWTYDRAIAIHEALGEKASLARDLQVKSYMQPHSEALEPLQRALQLAREAGDRRTELRVLGATGSALAGVERHGEALHYLLRALELAETIGAKHAQTSNLGDLTITFRRIGDLRRAWEYGQRALRHYREEGARSGEAVALLDLGDVCFERKDYACAADYHGRALEVMAERDSASWLDAVLRVAADFEAQGRHQAARDRIRQALENPRMADPRQAGKVRVALGELELADGRPREAIVQFEAAAKLVDPKWRSPETEIRILRGLASGYAALGERAKALDHYRQTIQRIETVRSGVTLASLRSTYFQDKRGLYAEAVDLLFDLHHAAPQTGHDREAFLIAERARARTLLDAVSGVADDPAPSRARERIRGEISAIQARLFREGLGDSARTELRTRLQQQERRLDDLELEALKSAPTPAVSVTGTMAVADAARLLSTGDLLVEFLLGPKRSYLFTVTPSGELGFHPLPARAALEGQLREFRELVARRPSPPETSQSIATIRQRGRQLFGDVFGAAAGQVRSARRLVIVPDGMLFYLPFEALSVEEDYLTATTEIVYAPSASVLAVLEPRRAESVAWERELVAFGDPSRPESAASSPPALVRSLEDGGFKFAALPSARHEVEAIARLFGRGSAKVFLGGRFQEGVVVAEIQRPTRYVHFATHAVLDEDVPGRSGLLTSLAENRDSAEDGILQARDIARLHVPAELVTLSACQTGLGRVVDGEGVLGLALAFQQAGANGLVVSLWSVSDVSTATFMTAFYGGLGRGSSHARALRAARAEMLRHSNPLLRHPYHWAGFVLIGAP